jgi:hypothetical protein
VGVTGRLWLAIALLSMVASCSESGAHDDLPSWGAEVDTYLSEFADAFDRHDLEATVAFFADGETFLVLPDGPHLGGVRRIEIFLRSAFDDEAAGMVGARVFVTASDDLGAGPPQAVSLSTAEHGPGAGCPAGSQPCRRSEMALVWMAAHRIRGLDMLAGLDEVSGDDATAAEALTAGYREAAALWATGDPARVALRFAEFGRVFDPFTGSEVEGHRALEAWAGESLGEGLDMEAVSMEDVGLSGDGPAVFYGGPLANPEIVGGVYRLRPHSGESSLIAMVWSPSPFGIQWLWWAHEVGADVVIDRPWWEGEPWWAGLAVPRPTVAECRTWRAAPGGAIELCNATDDLQDLTAWALGRFGEAGLDVPRPIRIGFPPSARCRTGSGWAIDTGDGVEIQMCLGQEAVEGGSSVLARFTLLHELAHVWTNEHLDDGGLARFLAARGLSAWWDPDLEWAELGAEHAAEILAWGLMDTALPITRLPDASCDRLEEGFRMLTGAGPIVSSAACEAVQGEPGG